MNEQIIVLPPRIIGDQAELVCNECGALMATVPAAEAEQTLLQMAIAPGVCTEVCPECGATKRVHHVQGADRLRLL